MTLPGDSTHVQVINHEAPPTQSAILGNIPLLALYLTNFTLHKWTVQGPPSVPAGVVLRCPHVPVLPTITTSSTPPTTAHTTAPWNIPPPPVFISWYPASEDGPAPLQLTL